MAKGASAVAVDGREPAFWNLEKKGSLPYADMYRNNMRIIKIEIMIDE